jgi:hypothetical protein
MIFTEENADKIVRGLKTETRRLWKSQHVYTGRVYPVRLSRRLPVPPDAPYIRIVTVYLEKLGMITKEAALREGCYDREDFFSLWKKIHGSVDKEQEVYVVRFRLATPLEIFVHQFSFLLKKYTELRVMGPDGKRYMAQSYEIKPDGSVELMLNGEVVGSVSVRSRVEISGINRRRKMTREEVIEDDE